MFLTGCLCVDSYILTYFYFYFFRGPNKRLGCFYIDLCNYYLPMIDIDATIKATKRLRFNQNFKVKTIKYIYNISYCKIGHKTYYIRTHTL